MRFLRAHDQILLVVRRHSSDRGDVRALLDRRRELVVAHALCREARRIGDDLDLAYVAPLHVDASDARDARDERTNLVAGDIVQRRRVAAFEVI